MKILIMGLPGAGKTWLAERLQKHLQCAWYNADKIREMANDWDFSLDGRHRQANRMRSLADFEKSYGRTVICDFVCPTDSTRKVFNPDILIWLDTIDSSKFEDTNKLFETPTDFDYRFNHWLSDKDIESLSELIKNV